MLRDDLEGRDRGVGGRLKKAGTYVCSWLIHIVDLEKEMATHCSILAWRIPWTEEPGTLDILLFLFGTSLLFHVQF